MRIIVGLGNPGRKYEGTPHNIGFSVIDELARMMSCSLRRSLRFNAKVAKASWNGEKVALLQPLTYMNNSGESVGAALRYWKADPSEVIVISDDADLDLGYMRIRAGGGSGGHKGIASLVQHLGTPEFARVRLGVGKGREGQSLERYVLERFSKDKMDVAGKIVALGAQAVTCLMESGIAEAMNKYNGRQDIE